MALDELKGKDLGTQTVVIERAPVPIFAAAVGEDPAGFSAEGDPVPPTFPFCWSYWGTTEGEVAGLPIMDLRGAGHDPARRAGLQVPPHAPHRRRARGAPRSPTCTRRTRLGGDGVLRDGDDVVGQGERCARRH
ncbi:MAG: hypothetical protein R2690_04970 [Acidimicrobiales bacterium]